MRTDDLLLEELVGSAYLQLNKRMCRRFNPMVAIFLSILIEKRRWCRQNEELHEGKWFYAKRESIEYEFNVSEYEQRKAMRLLEDLKCIETKTLNSTSRKIYYNIDSKQVVNLLSEIK